MKKQKKKDKSDWAVPAFLFIGIGIGLITGQVAGFTLIGLGVGFLVGYIFRKRK
tara:strand:- start:152 stop:313 length:162 start_codon:yes stop_codon:yes gene_type:complete